VALSRRTFLAGAAAAAAVAACSDDSGAAPASSTTAPPTTGPTTAPTTAPGTTGPSEPAPSTAGAATSAAATSAPTTAPTTTGSPSASRFVANGSRTGDAVALTFHAAGDTGRATRLLDLLARSRTPITVFAVGNWLAANPRLAQRILADGHELANHTWSHQAMGSLAASALGPEITRCAEAIRAAAGTIGRWFRPSGIDVPTPAILAAAAAAGYPTTVGYDIDSHDFQDPGAAAVRANVVPKLQAGAIVSLHFDHENTIEALPGILDALRAKGLRPVTTTTLLG
jgi:peptidoglycan/xylan/chitin deacetylase (PgdA/CDA1 family)